jgi:hypothetical protein
MNLDIGKLNCLSSNKCNELCSSACYTATASTYIYSEPPGRCLLPNLSWKTSYEIIEFGRACYKKQPLGIRNKISGGKGSCGIASYSMTGWEVEKPQVLRNDVFET